ncbi:MAG: helix-turn-helix transcriptional regulator [Alphaproteobacteria bacterium]|nr:helix-turn-helix transcriptional regulator [Alphaproteobacteria bacterium]
MERTSFATRECPIARALDLVGEWWTLLILRDAFHGIRRFDEFQRDLGIASNVLAERLAKLVRGGVFEKRRAAEDGRSFEYRLTEKGLDLYPVLVALAVWGDRWDGDPLGPRLRLVERDGGRPVPPIAVRDADGRAMRPHQVRVVAGPGAGPETLRLLGHGDGDGPA